MNTHKTNKPRQRVWSLWTVVLLTSGSRESVYFFLDTPTVRPRRPVVLVCWPRTRRLGRGRKGNQYINPSRRTWNTEHFTVSNTETIIKQILTPRSAWDHGEPWSSSVSPDLLSACYPDRWPEPGTQRTHLSLNINPDSHLLNNTHRIKNIHARYLKYVGT